MKYKYWLLWLSLFALIGCMTDRNAIMKVLTNPSSFDSVGKTFVKLHPCISTEPKRRIDTVYTPKEVPYYLFRSISCPDGTIVHDTVKGKIKYIDTGTHTIDTIPDTRAINILTDDNNNLRSANSTLQALNSSSCESLKEIQARRDFWQFWAILLGCIAGLLVVALIFKSFRL